MKKKLTDSTNGVMAKLKKTKNKALKTERKVESSDFNIGRMIILGFWGIVAGVCLFSFLAFSRTGFLNEKINGYQAEAKEGAGRRQLYGICNQAFPFAGSRYLRAAGIYAAGRRI